MIKKSSFHEPQLNSKSRRRRERRKQKSKKEISSNDSLMSENESLDLKECFDDFPIEEIREQSHVLPILSENTLMQHAEVQEPKVDMEINETAQLEVQEIQQDKEDNIIISDESKSTISNQLLLQPLLNEVSTTQVNMNENENLSIEFKEISLIEDNMITSTKINDIIESKNDIYESSSNSSLYSERIPATDADLVSIHPITSIKVTVHYTTPGPLYIDLKARPQGIGAVIRAFRRAPDGTKGAAEESGQVNPGDLLYAINEQDVTDLLFNTIVQMAKTVEFPASLTFMKSSPSMSRLLLEEENALDADPPVPTRNNSHWISSKFGQFIESNRRKSVIDPLIKSSNSPLLKRRSVWQERVNLEKVKQVVGDFKENHSDPMRSLWKKMGRRPSDDDRDSLILLIRSIYLEQEGLYLTSKIIPKSNDGSIEDKLDEGALVVAWYRHLPSGLFLPIQGALGTFYYPSANDIGAKICIQCQTTRNPDQCSWAEIVPKGIDPKIEETVNSIVESGAGSFSATLMCCERISLQLKVDQNSIRLVHISEEDSYDRLIAESEYHRYVQVFLQPHDPYCFILRVTRDGTDLGNVGEILGNSTDLSNISKIYLLAQSPENRDMIALCIRKFRSLKIPLAEDDSARNEELGLIIKADGKEDLTNAFVLQEEFSKRWDVDEEEDDEEEEEEEEDNEENEENEAEVSSNIREDIEFKELGNLNEKKDALAEFNSRFNSSISLPETQDTSLLHSANVPFEDGLSKDSLEELNRNTNLLQDQLNSLQCQLCMIESEKKILLSTISIRDECLSNELRQMNELKRNIYLLSQENNSLQEKCKSAALTEEKVNTLQQELESIKIQNKLMTEEISLTKQNYSELHERLKASQEEIVKLKEEKLCHEQEKLELISDRNALKIKMESITKELRRFVSGGRTVEEVNAQMDERTQLKVQLSLARADYKQVLDETNEYKARIESMKKIHGMEANDITRMVLHYNELKTLTENLTLALADKQVALDNQKDLNAILGRKVCQLEKQINKC